MRLLMLMLLLGITTVRADNLHEYNVEYGVITEVEDWHGMSDDVATVDIKGNLFVFCESDHLVPGDEIAVLMDDMRTDDITDDEVCDIVLIR